MSDRLAEIELALPLHRYDSKKDAYQNGGLVDANGKELWGGYDGGMPSEEQIDYIVEAVNQHSRLEAALTDMTRGNTGLWARTLRAEGMEAAASIPKPQYPAHEPDAGYVSGWNKACGDFRQAIRAAAKEQADG